MSFGNNNQRMGRSVVLIQVTTDLSLPFVTGMAYELTRRGLDVHVVSSPGTARSVRGVQYHPFPLTRDVSSLLTPTTWWRWVRLCRSLRPKLIIAGTPVAAFLAMIGGKLCRVPIRVYAVWGLRYETSTGVARFILKTAERLTMTSATHVCGVSDSVRKRALAERLTKGTKIEVIGSGSSHGVEIARFKRNDKQVSERRAQWWGAKERVPVLGYVGRFHPDKGIDLLISAVRILSSDIEEGVLLIVGMEDGIHISTAQSTLRGSKWRLEITGHVDDPEEYYPLMDLLCLPTKREGLPNVVLEAAVAGVPTVATAATGVSDAIIDGVTGLICQERDPVLFAEYVRRLLKDDGVRVQMGRAASQRAERVFDSTLVINMNVDRLTELLRG
jgi:glycosyltransferase involved in cell wall biosynthesis